MIYKLKLHSCALGCESLMKIITSLNKPLQAELFMRMQKKIINLPSGTSTAIQSSVLESGSYEGRNNETKKWVE